MKIRMIRLIAAVTMFVIFLTVSVSAGLDYNLRTTGSRYRDVPNATWAKDSVKFVLNTGLMSNCGRQNYFEAEQPLTRSMFVQVFKRLAQQVGRDTTYTASNRFTDCTPANWYYDAVEWAAANDIAQGSGDGTFLPSAQITREQLAVFMYRFLTMYCGTVLPENVEVSTFADDASIHRWAREAITACVGAGLLQGKNDNCFDPLANATRAEAAVLVKRLNDYYRHDPVCLTQSELALTFSDEFDGESLNTEKWNIACVIDPALIDGQDNNSAAYQNAHVFLQDGSLVLRSDYTDSDLLNPASDKYVPETGGMGCPAGVTTQGKFTQARGYYEMRAKLTKNPGKWDAFWMICGDGVDVREDPSNVSCEIDILETSGGLVDQYGHTNQLKSTIHWKHVLGPGHPTVKSYLWNSTQQTQQGDYVPVDFYDGEYHTISMLWTDTEYIFYYDGYEIWRTDMTENGGDGVCENPGFLFLSSHYYMPDTVGYCNPADFPSDYLIDYVRVYQFNDAEA